MPAPSGAVPARARSGGLEVRELSKRYGEHVAVDDVSITVDRGSFVTFLGPSGSGKTTILMAVAGFVQPSAGTILLDGADITQTPAERRNFGMVFQGYALFPHMSVEENVWFPLRVRGVGRAAARDVVRRTLDLVQMAHLGGRLPTELSGGQQQRVALARALVFEPSLLLLDEPLSALDKALRADLQWELKTLHRRLGATFVNVTHDQEEALSMSDRVVILREGRIVQSGTPTELYAQPQTRFVAAFLGESNFINGTVVERSDDRFTYTVGGERFVQRGTFDAGSDAPVLVSLRPENTIVAPERPDTANAVEGRIADFKYVGSSYFLQIETQVLGRLMVRTGGGSATVEPTSEASVWVGWNPDASVVVRDN